MLASSLRQLLTLICTNLVEDSVGERWRALLVRGVEVVPRADVVLVGRREGDLGLAVPAEDEALPTEVVELVKVQDG